MNWKMALWKMALWIAFGVIFLGLGTVAEFRMLWVSNDPADRVIAGAGLMCLWPMTLTWLSLRYYIHIEDEVKL
jgi:vacuolar-type H+-ATPase subunit I/STV1